MDEINESADTGPMDDVASAFLEDDDEVVAEDDDAAAEESDADDEPESEEEESDEPSGRYKVTVKDAQGNEVEQHISFDELRAGYLKGREVDSVRAEVDSKVFSARQEVFVEAQKSFQQLSQQLATHEAMVRQALDVVSTEQMTSLTSDPAAYVSALERVRTLEKVQRGIQESQAQLTYQQQMADAEAIRAAEKELARNGVPAEGITKIYDSVAKAYGVKPQSLAALRDPALVLALKDALELKELKAKKPEVAKKLREAPKLPPSKLQSPRRVDSKREQRFKTRSATVDDLAAIFMD